MSRCSRPRKDIEDPGISPLMYGRSAYRPLMRPRSPSCLSLRPVTRVRFPPPLSPATTIRSASTFKLAALATNHFSPDMQSLSPAGNGGTSGTEEGTIEFLKSTMTTATPFAAMSLPQPRYIPS